MRKHQTYNLTRLTALAAILAATPTASAQNRSGQIDGRRLDNNLMQGSGGINSPSAAVDFRARNNLITGNVPGLGYFHGNVGYRAPGDFHGRAGSDSLFRFQAQSLPTPGIAGFDAERMSRGVFRGITPTSVQDVYSGLLPSLVTTHGADTRNMVNRLPSAYAGPSFNLDTQSSASVSDRLGLGYQVVRNGIVQEMSASPFLGVRRVDPGDLRNLWQNSSPDMPLAPTDDSARTADVRMDNQPFKSTPTSNATVSGLQDVSPMLPLGVQVSTLLAPVRVQDISSLDAQVERIEARLFSPLGTVPVQPGEDVYLDILSRIRDKALLATNQDPQDPERLPTDRLGARPQPKQTPPASRPGDAERATPVRDPLTGPALVLAGDDPSPSRQAFAAGKLTAEDLAKARQERDLAMSRARGLTIPPTPDKSAPPLLVPNVVPELVPNVMADPLRGTVGQANPNLKEGEKEPLPASLEALIESFKHDGMTVATLAGKRESLVDDLFRQAENHLAQEHYFDAEGSYRALLELDPGQPLAQAGRIHAQLAVGMIHSASLNLRRLLEEHPELAGIRYDAKLLPSPKRLGFIREQLDEMVRLNKRSDPAVTLAYLAYQFDLPDVAQYALDIAQARAPQDPLLPLLRKVWLGSAAAPAPSPGKP